MSNKHLGSTFDEFLEGELIDFDPTITNLRADREVMLEYEKLQDYYDNQRKILRLEQKIAVLIQEIHGLRIQIDHLKGEY